VDMTPLPDETCSPAAPSVPDSQRKRASRESSRGAARARPALLHAADPASVPDGAIVVYADGACSGNPGPAGLGVVLLDGGTRSELSEFLGEGTNNIAELTAILRALEMVGDHTRPVIIHTDSSYSIGVLQKGWRAKANVALVDQVKRALRARPGARLVYVPGHAGVVLNERADELARQAVRSRRTVRSSVAADGGASDVAAPVTTEPSRR
jgi:ribonuclease HI